MYSASTAYKNIIKGLTSQNVAYVTLTDTTDSTSRDIDGAQIKNILIECDAIPNKEILGSVAQANCKIIFTGDIASALDLSHVYEIKPYIGVYLSDGITKEYVPYQPFIMGNPTYDKATLTTSADCVDYMKKFDKPFVDANTYPITLLAFVQNICAQAGVTLSNSTIFNGTFSIATKPYFDNATLKQVLTESLKVALSFAYINRTGQVAIKKLSDIKSQTSVETIDRTTARELELGQDNFKVQGINTLVLKLDNVVTGENVTRSDSAMITVDGNVEISISNSPILWNEAIKTSVIDAMFAEIKGFKFKAYTVSSKVAPYLDLGDVITLDTSDEAYIDRYIITLGGDAIITKASSNYLFPISYNNNAKIISSVLAYSLSFDGAIRVELKATTMSLTDTAYKNEGTLSTRVKHTEIMVDKVNGIISLLVQDITTLDGRTATNESSIIINSEAIASKVSSTDYNGDTIASLINQTADTIKISANHIQLEGVITANDYFKINLDGSIEALAGLIAGFTIGPISSISNSLGIRNGYLPDGQQNSNATGMSNNTDWAFWAGNGRFRVQQDGYLYSNSGNIAGWDINASSISKGSVSLDSANGRLYFGSRYLFTDSAGIGIEGTCGIYGDVFVNGQMSAVNIKCGFGGAAIYTLYMHSDGSVWTTP